MRTRLLVLIAALVLIPGLAVAQSWQENNSYRTAPPSTHAGGTDTERTNIRPGQVLCYDFDETDNDDSPTFWIQGGIGTLRFNPDVLTTTDTAAAKIYLYCGVLEPTSASDRTKSFKKVPRDSDGDGAPDADPYLDGTNSGGETRYGYWGLEPGPCFINVDTAPDTDDDARVCVWVR